MLFKADTGLKVMFRPTSVLPVSTCLPAIWAPGLPMKEKSKYPGSLRVKVRERKRDYEVPLKLTSAARWITSKQLQRAAS